MSAALELVILARQATLRRRPTAAALGKALARFAPAGLEPAAWRDLVVAAHARLREVDSAAELARRVPDAQKPSWRAWIGLWFPAIALGLPPARMRKAGRAGWAAAIVAHELGIEAAGAKPSASRLGDALVWRELGLSGPPAQCPGAIRAHVLRRLVDTDGDDPERLLAQLAAKQLAAPRADLDALRTALLRRWLAPAPASLVDDVRQVASRAQRGVFGERKVFISSVWDALRETPAWSQLALDDLKQQLVAAHRARELELARADLVGAMDPALVAASETHTDGATFHFVVREAHA